MALVTVGISFYNAERFLDDAIRSVINQIYSEWILVLLDDGSVDNSLGIAAKYSGESRIKIISDGQNKGLIYRLNQLISMCNTKYFARMDADDIMHPERLQKQIDFLEANPLVDIVGSWAYSIDINNKILGILKTIKNPKSLSNVLEHSCFIHPSIIGKTSWFKKNQYDIDFFRIEDMELWGRTIENSSFYNLTEPLLFYREVGIPYLSKYLQSMRGERKLVKRIYAEKAFIYRCYRLFKNYVKSLLYICFTVIGLQTYLIKHRSLSISFVDYQRGIKSLYQALK